MIATELQEGEVLGTCEHCGDECIIFADNQRCDECDGQFTHCLICDEEQHEDDPCRHVFRDWKGDYEWYGSGGYAYFADHVRESFFCLLRLMPNGFASDLRHAILSGEFYTFASLPMIGGGGHIELHAPYESDFYWGCMWEYGYKMVDIGERQSSERTSLGYKWLASLYKSKTTEANQLTVALLDWWLAGRTRLMLTSQSLTETLTVESQTTETKEVAWRRNGSGDGC